MSPFRLPGLTLACATILLVAAPCSARLFINEFMASNNTTLDDVDGNSSDWLELSNDQFVPVNLDGWYLTDDPLNLTRWRLPQVTIPAKGYLVVFASGKDRAVAGSQLHTNFKLSSGGEYLALVEPDGVTIHHAYSPQFPEQLADVSYGLGPGSAWGYFFQPTPGAANGALTGSLGPEITEVLHAPHEPLPGEPVKVTAAIASTTTVVASAQLRYTIMYGQPTAIPMVDNGTAGDALANDGIYTAFIPGNIANPGEMLRYIISAVDGNGDTGQSPAISQLARQHGLVYKDTSIQSFLPVLHWFVEDPKWNIIRGFENNRDETATCLYFNGEFYDNVTVRRRGQSTDDSPKQALKFDFDGDPKFKFSPDLRRVEEFNLQSTYFPVGTARFDDSFMREVLAYETFRTNQIPASLAFNMHIRQNGQFFSVATFLEQVDDRFLERNGLDENGSLYKAVGKPDGYLVTTDGIEKRTNKDEPSDDLVALVQSLKSSGSTLQSVLFDTINVPQVINYIATGVILKHTDNQWHNYYLYHDINGTREWSVFPWDLNLTFFAETYWTPANNDRRSHPLYGDADHPQYSGGEYNRLFGALLMDSRTKAMYLRRLRTVMDTWLQAPGTNLADGYFENRMNSLYAAYKFDADLDFAKWGLYEIDLGEVRDNFLASRRNYLYGTHAEENGGIIPLPVPTEAIDIRITEVRATPASGNPLEEYIRIRNFGNRAVDLSGWSVTGAVSMTFQEGVVLTPGDSLYLSPDVVAFRNRSTSPKRGESAFVQGPYSGYLPNTGGSIDLVTGTGNLVDSFSFAATASSAQQAYLRITEIMYHPFGGEAARDLEFIEISNVSSAPLSVTGIRFTDGIDWTLAEPTTLPPLGKLIVAKDPDLFKAAYPSVLSPVSGPYDGYLSNSGERIRLLDANLDPISVFAYHDSGRWPQLADGAGSSLEAVGAWPAGGNASDWIASPAFAGSPGIWTPSAVRIEALTPAGGSTPNATLDYYTTTGQAYLIEESTDLLNWNPVHSSAGDGNRQSIVRPRGGSNAYYRISLQGQ
ncbi:MAG: lamin tail domain-containing protein [Puniceicoccaceae bacterium]